MIYLAMAVSHEQSLIELKDWIEELKRIPPESASAPEQRKAASVRGPAR